MFKSKDVQQQSERNFHDGTWQETSSFAQITAFATSAVWKHRSKQLSYIIRAIVLRVHWRLGEYDLEPLIDEVLSKLPDDVSLYIW